MFKIIVLGSSAALPAYGRFTTSQLVEIQNRHFLVDCGEGTQTQLTRYQISCLKINHVFISHLHGDHYLGLIGLLFSMHLKRRTNDLHLHAPRGLDEIILLHLKYSKSVLNYTLHFHIIEPEVHGVIYEDDAVTVESIPLFHKIDTTGFLFREKIKPHRIDKARLQEGMLLQHIAQLKTGVDIKDAAGNTLYRNEDFTLPPRPSFSYAFCSDTGYSERIVEMIRGVSLLYHEATFLERDKDKAIETKHSTAADAATIARKAEVEHLAIGHFSARYQELDELLAEAAAIFPGTSLAIEGKIFELDA